jgi:hypothetical protein
MKKVVLNISESTYEKLRFEALQQKISIREVITKRIFHVPFDEEVENAYQELLEFQFQKMISQEEKIV